MTRDERRVAKALKEAKSSQIEIRMAFILLAVNGLDNALGYVERARQKREEGSELQPRLGI